jgi:hypothetical protein
MLPLGCAGAICMDEYDLSNDVATSLFSLTGIEGIVRGNFPKRAEDLRPVNYLHLHRYMMCLSIIDFDSGL